MFGEKKLCCLVNAINSSERRNYGEISNYVDLDVSSREDYTPPEAEIPERQPEDDLD